MNFSEMPVEIWADMLEESGEDTTELREWIASGLKVNESDFYTINSYHYGNYYGDGDGHGNGQGYSYNSSIGNGYGSGGSYGYGYGYEYGYGRGDGNGHGDRYGNGYDDSTEDE